MTTLPELSTLIPSRSVSPVLDAEDIHVRWVVPEVFHDLPLQETDDDEAVRLLEELVENALPGAAEDERTRFGLICALGVDDLRATGTEYAAVCLTAVDDTVCSATMSATLVDSPDARGVRGAVEAIASSLAGIEVAEVSEIELPCGPGVSCIGTRQEKLPASLTEAGENLGFPVAYIRVYVPLPNDTTVVMEMSTPTMTGWDAFSTMFGNVVSSIRLFNADGSALITSGTGQ
ncbi:hypothetical protein CW362_05890 [Streptomyces populi]|uniref:Uncharacterized protein n=1 Tax=Streptomyces populi TaxID=2058924 RepID=A0A2I0SVG6_9ACTN|nr:hypothetical protein [Streptomyces populi]PKT73883.1 hypothetical protein CW362_05890 [Streptomyces populi]